jgi:hypothetical protein
LHRHFRSGDSVDVLMLREGAMPYDLNVRVDQRFRLDSH